MRKIFLLPAIIGILLFTSVSSYAQEEDAAERVLVLRQARQHRKTSAAVEAYLIGNVLEVKVVARIHRAKPRIFSLILVGPGIGRISAKERKTLFAKAKDENLSFPTDERGGFITFSARTKDKKLKGTLTRELHKIEIPVDKIRSDKRYQLWVKVESMKLGAGGKLTTFKFNLEDFPELLGK